MIAASFPLFVLESSNDLPPQRNGLTHVSSLHRSRGWIPNWAGTVPGEPIKKYRICKLSGRILVDQLKLATWASLRRGGGFYHALPGGGGGEINKIWLLDCTLKQVA